MIALAILTALAASVVIAEAVCLLNRMHWSTHAGGYLHFLGFGLAHALLAMGALLMLLDATDGEVFVPGAIVTVACALRTVFELRGARR